MFERKLYIWIFLFIYISISESWSSDWAFLKLLFFSLHLCGSDLLVY